MEDLGPCNDENIQKWKTMIREGIPDSYKRKCIMQFFGLKSEDVKAQYDAAKKLAGEDMLKIAQTSRVA